MGWVFHGLDFVSVFVSNIGIACSLWGHEVPRLAKTRFRQMLLYRLLVMTPDAKNCN